MKIIIKKILWQIRSCFFPPVGRKTALKIAKKRLCRDENMVSIHSRRPSNVNPYELPDEPGWFVLAATGLMLRNSHLIVVSKITGRVIYDGSANDEG